MFILLSNKYSRVDVERITKVQALWRGKRDRKRVFEKRLAREREVNAITLKIAPLTQQKNLCGVPHVNLPLFPPAAVVTHVDAEEKGKGKTENTADETTPLVGHAVFGNLVQVIRSSAPASGGEEEATESLSIDQRLKLLQKQMESKRAAERKLRESERLERQKKLKEARDSERRKRDLERKKRAEEEERKAEEERQAAESARLKKLKEEEDLRLEEEEKERLRQEEIVRRDRRRREREAAAARQEEIRREEEVAMQLERERVDKVNRLLRLQEKKQRAQRQKERQLRREEAEEQKEEARRKVLLQRHEIRMRLKRESVLLQEAGQSLSAALEAKDVFGSKLGEDAEQPVAVVEFAKQSMKGTYNLQPRSPRSPRLKEGEEGFKPEVQQQYIEQGRLARQQQLYEAYNEAQERRAAASRLSRVSLSRASGSGTPGPASGRTSKAERGRTSRNSDFVGTLPEGLGGLGGLAPHAPHGRPSAGRKRPPKLAKLVAASPFAFLQGTEQAGKLTAFAGTADSSALRKSHQFHAADGSLVHHSRDSWLK
mmetsp:Transcript_44837/g.87905  ORF Transcript_44837/g.87905 Transcript_44837/m.87905 type:complete len:544 (-) Transcript_44837:240-1871(-)